MSTYYFLAGALRFTERGRVEMARGVSNPDLSVSPPKKEEIPSWQKPYQLRDRWNSDGEKMSAGPGAKSVDHVAWHLLSNEQRLERKARIEAIESGYSWERVKLSDLSVEELLSIPTSSSPDSFKMKLLREGWPDDVEAYQAATRK